ncbi:hypothetical protein PoB_002184200 [Plakobranchus ocellatus]|uniref:Uncharacterized protein n=1 Tax=Plakobranchus ocellatus TaxID=259542 RepID=A0AAV3ZL55_9GAST|nr:hypothetical protein PoB_002184200 [Plakobranchus ocellatus]
MTSREQQVHNGRGRHKIGGNGRHLLRATSCSGWTKPPNNQDISRIASTTINKWNWYSNIVTMFASSQIDNTF